MLKILCDQIINIKFIEDKCERNKYTAKPVKILVGWKKKDLCTCIIGKSWIWMVVNEWIYFLLIWRAKPSTYWHDTKKLKENVYAKDTPKIILSIYFHGKYKKCKENTVG